jgi:hypothetical protein
MQRVVFLQWLYYFCPSLLTLHATSLRVEGFLLGSKSAATNAKRYSLPFQFAIHFPKPAVSVLNVQLPRTSLCLTPRGKEG